LIFSPFFAKNLEKLCHSQKLEMYEGRWVDKI
jgi:hypothetical protein